MENYICPECGNIMDRKYSKKDDCLHLNMVEYDEDNDEFFCSECE